MICFIFRSFVINKYDDCYYVVFSCDGGSAMTSWSWWQQYYLCRAAMNENLACSTEPGSLPWQSAHTLVIKWLMHTKRYSDHIHAGYRYILWPKNVKSRCQAALYKLNLGFDITVDVAWSGTAARLCYNRQYAEVKSAVHLITKAVPVPISECEQASR